MGKAIIDGDMLVYRVGFATEVETQWDEDLFTLHTSFSEMKKEVYNFIDKIKNKVGLDEVHIVFSPSYNFRYELMPDYKKNRKGKRKPLGMKQLKEWMHTEFDCVTAQNMEADDLIGILCTFNKDNIAVSGDKDFATLPITWYNFITDETVSILPKEAKYNHYVQTLAGDVTDGYAGVKGIGIKTAKRILDKNGVSWKTIVDAYEKAGMTEEEAILNARMAYILQVNDYDAGEGKIVLWEPPTED